MAALAAEYDAVKCLTSISKGSSRAVPICLHIASTKGSNDSFGRPGFAMEMSSPCARSSIAPAPIL